MESGNDSGCENYSDRKSTDNDSSHHSSRTRSISPISDEDSGAPTAKRAKMIDVVTVDSTPMIQNQRNLFSIRNLIYSKDTSDSDTDNRSEDSGNAPSASHGSSPPRPWSPDQEILRKLKEDLSTTLHQFVDTVVQDVVAKVASNYRDTLTKQKATTVLEPKARVYKNRFLAISINNKIGVHKVKFGPKIEIFIKKKKMKFRGFEIKIFWPTFCPKFCSKKNTIV